MDFYDIIFIINIVCFIVGIILLIGRRNTRQHHQTNQPKKQISQKEIDDEFIFKEYETKIQEIYSNSLENHIKSLSKDLPRFVPETIIYNNGDVVFNGKETFAKNEESCRVGNTMQFFFETLEKCLYPNNENDIKKSFEEHHQNHKDGDFSISFDVYMKEHFPSNALISEILKLMTQSTGMLFSTVLMKLFNKEHYLCLDYTEEKWHINIILEKDFIHVKHMKGCKMTSQMNSSNYFILPISFEFVIERKSKTLLDIKHSFGSIQFAEQLDDSMKQLIIKKLKIKHD